MKRMTIEIDDDEIHKAIKVEAAKSATTVKDYILVLIKKDLETKKEQTQ